MKWFIEINHFKATQVEYNLKLGNSSNYFLSFANVKIDFPVFVTKK